MIRTLLNRYNIKPISYKNIGKVVIINDKYVFKNSNNSDIYKYLNSRDFNFLPNFIDKDFDFYYFINDRSDDNKIYDFINVIATLHNKTSYISDINTDDIKFIYDDIINKLNGIYDYYNSLNDYIDSILFYSPSMYLIINNISIIYRIIDYLKIKIDKWYKDYSNINSITKCLIHNNIDINHLIIDDKYYLISFDNSIFSYCIYDLENIIFKYNDIISIDDILGNYLKINNIDKCLYDLLFINLLLPKQLIINDDFDNLEYIDNYFNYLYNLFNYVKDLK